MLIGGDISHHNHPFEVGFAEFQIFKATEGKTYVDPKLGDYMKNVKKDDLIAFYHYARPDVSTNSPEMEARHFYEVVKPYIGRAIFVLDWEGAALKYNEGYALRWLVAVEQFTGVRPILYMSSSATKKFPNVAKMGYELWVANYNVKSPTVHCFKDWLMWQFTRKPFDVDLFKGTEADWRARCISRL